MAEFRLDDLNLDGLQLLQNPSGYNFTSDSVLLANFVSAKHTHTCLEIGAGCGVISILVNYKTKPKKIIAFEFQKSLADLAENNVKLNKMSENISILHQKIQNYANFIKNESIDVVFSNPPYYNSANNFVSANAEVANAKHEINLSLSELCGIVKNVLVFGGKFYVMYPAERLVEIVSELTKNNLMPKRMFFVQPTLNKNASVVLIECVKGGKNGVKILPTLITNTLDGDYVQTIQKLYKN